MQLVLGYGIHHNLNDRSRFTLTQ